MDLSLISILNSIELPDSGQNFEFSFYVKPIPKFEKHYFGKICSGEPTLLLGSKDRSIKSPVRLSELEVSFSVPCDISNSDGSYSTETFTSITCKSKDTNLQGYFIHICETLLRIVGNSPSLDQIENAVERLVELFQKLNNPPRRTVVGLFGELYSIHVAKSPELALQAWRSNIDDRYDFSMGDIRLEVKTTSAGNRTHEFSLNQCQPPLNSTGIIVSLCVETSGGGLSLQNLIERIENQIVGKPELQLKLTATVVEGLGNNLSKALSMCFDEHTTRSSMRIYEIDNIPTVCKELPNEVSHVRFKCDLTNVIPSIRENIASESEILDKILPNNLHCL